MPRMIDDETFDAVAEDLKHCKHGESDFREDLLKAPSVDLLDLGKVQRWDTEVVFNHLQNPVVRYFKSDKGPDVAFSDLQSLVTPRQWISVSERLPAGEDTYLVSDGESVWISEWFGTYWCDELELDVTHWQPLPPPPKDLK